MQPQDLMFADIALKTGNGRFRRITVIDRTKYRGGKLTVGVCIDPQNLIAGGREHHDFHASYFRLENFRLPLPGLNRDGTSHDRH